MGIVEVRQRIRRPIIAALGMAGSTIIWGRREAPRIIEMLRLTVRRDWLTEV
jgi:hypothetical protein